MQSPFQPARTRILNVHSRFIVEDKMLEQSFSKLLTSNDTGASGGHQVGIHIPKSEVQLISFLPRLDASTKNPSNLLHCFDDAQRQWEFRYVYYNNKLHDPEGTRDEYLITRMTGFMRTLDAQPGDIITISGIPRSNSIKLVITPLFSEHVPQRIKLAGWLRIY